ncbi:hypothetical protein ACFP7A_09740 [Sporolactobacillus kofuensis]|uniref:Uncharacterized protein n=1 Tax=Sporolactobacillus kofuensis TaxID=269672 RepID=A0ABW1WHS5_9BACL|nr:hypothetical protein [Sporolactobacillus kofuensis]MCO7176157.1 hypothetical protein [Sporolactobacillus kofuensis]
MRKGSVQQYQMIGFIVIFGLILSSLLTWIYHFIHLSIGVIGFVLLFIAVQLAIYMVYRNKWQFRRFYSGWQRQKLSHQVTWLIITLIIVLFIIAPMF